LLHLNLACGNDKTAAEDELMYPYSLSLQELTQIKVVSASLEIETIDQAPSNITVVTNDMISQRGYRTLVEVLQDVPGFDFLIYNDGGGEWSSFSITRGAGGDLGNLKTLIMVDGIPQDMIGLNWSPLWTFEQLFIDLDRIEIVQGPGSALYGAQAFAGVIHFITKDRFDGTRVHASAGSYDSYELSAHHGKQNGEANYSLAMRYYQSNGDDGDQRIDPGNYFHNNIIPFTTTRDYDAQGDFLQGAIHPRGGQALPPGFSNWVDTFSSRVKFQWRDIELGGFYWDIDRGSGSYIAGYEYEVSSRDHQNHFQGYHVYAKSRWQFNSEIYLENNLVHRRTAQMPDTRVLYTYRFPNLAKSFFSHGYQSYLEERLHWQATDKHRLLLGFRYMHSDIVTTTTSLGTKAEPYHKGTPSSWDIALIGGGLNQPIGAPHVDTDEFALYMLWNYDINDQHHLSTGIRYDRSDGYGSVTNPRVGWVYRLNSRCWTKLLYGEAFRQPSTLETIGDEFRRNPDLEPETVKTIDAELNFLPSKNLLLKLNLFHSKLDNLVGLSPNPSLQSGFQWNNIDDAKIRGFTFSSKWTFTQNSSVYANYHYQEGKKSNADGDWGQIDSTAKHKLNTGVFWRWLPLHVDFDFRINWVGKRKAPETNVWLVNNRNGFAPSYIKANLSLTYTRYPTIKPQLLIDNVFNEDYYGIARGSGSGDREAFDPANNINPPGFLPPYHPQPERRFMLRVSMAF
jgi:outer membrane receptor protein involved in Fe transport